MITLVTGWKKFSKNLSSVFPGLILVISVAIVSRFLHGLIPGQTLHKAISDILVAVVLGLCLRNTLGVSVSLEPGIKFALKRFLSLGIILLGLRLSLQDVVAIGVSALLLVLVCITVALTLAYAAGRVFDIPPRLATLIGVGTAICGNSAIVATSPVIDAKDEDVSFAVATITLFGLLAVIFYPIIGHVFAFSDRVFGMWAGTAVNDTSQVVAAGVAYSAGSLNIATVVKLTRNTLMAPLIVGIGLVYHRRKTAGDKSQPKMTLSKIVPWFVLGFLALSLVRTAGIAAGILPQSVDKPGDLQSAAAMLIFFDEVAKFAILTALASVGLGTNIQSLRKIGFKPFVVGFFVAATLAVVSISLILVFGG